MQDIDAQLIHRARVAPRDGVMADSSAAMLGKTAHDREARVLCVKEGVTVFYLLLGQQFGVCAIQDHRVAPPDKRVALRVRVHQVDDAPLADHRVVIQVLLQPFPEFQ